MTAFCTVLAVSCARDLGNYEYTELEGPDVSGISESYEILTLERLKDTQVDMFTTVFIGNSNTMELNGRMVTPRGYKNV